MIERDAFLTLNHSDGKDSQTATVLLSRVVPRNPPGGKDDDRNVCVMRR